MTSNEKSLIDQYQSFPRGAQELSAARLAQSVARALDSSLSASGKTAREIAKLLGVTEGAVSQVLNAEGNVRIATLGRYLRAMGYQARIEVTPIDASVPPVAQPRRRQRREPTGNSAIPREKSVTVSVSRCNVTDGNVVAQALLLVLPHDEPAAASAAQSHANRENPVWHILDAGMPESSLREGWRMSASSRRAQRSSRSRSSDARGVDESAGTRG